MSTAWTVNGSTVTPDDDRVTLEGVSLILSPVTTSDSGNYTCTLNITSLRPYVTFKVLNEAIADLAVKSKLPKRFIRKEQLMFVACIPSVPPPDVELYLRPEPFYAGTTLTLTCTVSVDPNVNNNEKVVIEWTPAQDGRISVDTTVRVSNSSYESSLTINPLAKEDSGIFVCMGIIIGGSSSATDTSNISIQVIGEYSILASTYVLLRDFIFLDLPDPNVTLSSTTVSLAGEEEKLMCTVTTVEYLSESAILSLTWSGGSVGSSGVTESGTVNVSETTSISNLTFSPLSTLHGAKYSCQAVIEIPSINVIKTGTEDVDLIVKSETTALC